MLRIETPTVNAGVAFSDSPRARANGRMLSKTKRFKEMEKENAKRKRPVAELSPDKQILKDVVEGNF